MSPDHLGSIGYTLGYYYKWYKGLLFLLLMFHIILLLLYLECLYKREHKCNVRVYIILLLFLFKDLTAARHDLEDVMEKLVCDLKSFFSIIIPWTTLTFK